MTNEEKLSKALQDFKTKYQCITSADLQTFIIGWQEAVKNCFIPDVSNSYCGEQGNDNMKADIKEIMHAVGDKFDFIRLCNEAQEELDEAAFDLDQESRMNGV
jgi:hypothetical protein